MKLSYEEMIEQGIPVVFDGALGTQIQKLELRDEDFAGKPGCNEILNLTCPDHLIAIYKKYLDAGANVLETNTFGGSAPKLKEYGLENQVYQINKTGAEIAKKAIEIMNLDVPTFVSGGIGPTGFLPSSSDESLSGVDFDQLVAIFSEQAAGLLDGGVDLILIETVQDILEVRAAICGIKEQFVAKGRTVPIQVQITMDVSGRMLLGSDTKAFLGAVASMGVCAVGLNCSTGPTEMKPVIEQLLEFSNLPVSMLPNAGLPENIEGVAVYNLDPESFAEQLAPMVYHSGVSIVGGCCGTGPDHIRALVNKLKNRQVFKRAKKERTCTLSSSISGIDLESISRPIIIGERLNAQGSKKTKELLLQKNWDELTHIAIEQIKHGSSVIDLCAAMNERDDELCIIETLVKYLAERVEVPFCIDSTEPSVIQAALKRSPGSAMINSINLEHGGVKARQILALAKKFGSPVIALTIDDSGMAKSVDQKVAIAKRLFDLACNEYGLPSHFLYIDPLVFTLATGDPQTADAAIMSLDALKAIKAEMPGVRTVMGVSNVSYGLKPAARRVLNNLMLHYAVEAGLDAAIFNPLHLDSVDSLDQEIRLLGENLLFNRSASALEQFALKFETAPAIKKVSAIENTKVISAAQLLTNAILDRDRRSLAHAITEQIKVMEPLNILNTILLPAMTEVGERMAKGEMILPFVLQAAEIMREAVTMLEPYLKSTDSTSKGTIVIATVYGDVHDIGKNLVASILRNQGYKVIDLGKQVSVDTIIDTIKREKPDAVGLSALLVTTSREMKKCVEACSANGISIPIIIGGAAVNRDFADRISVLENGKKYDGGVFFARDAFDASRILESDLLTAPPKKKKPARKKVADVAASTTSSADEIVHELYTEPPFYGTSEILTWNAKSILDTLDTTRLFKAWWGGGKLSSDLFEETRKKEFESIWEQLKKEIVESELIDARGFYGFFPVFTNDTEVVLLDPADFHTELDSFKFSRDLLTTRSIADYIRPEGDVVGIQIVTIGKALGERCRAYLTLENKYTLGFYLNGIGNYITELLADKVTKEMQRALGIKENVGCRYSFGYPGVPGVEQQGKLFQLLAVEDRLNVTLTSGFQMDPEHSTMGIFIRHAAASYQ